MDFPLWAFFGLCAAGFSALMLLLQERYKVDGFALSFWNKITCIAVMAPFVVYHGLPTNILFYVFLFASASLWAVSDVIFFRAIPEVGAGPVSRILPSSVIFGFIVWFLFRPETIQQYLDNPAIGLMICLVLVLWVYFATHMKRCAVSMQAVRKIWFVFFASIVGPAVGKMVTEQAAVGQGAYAYVFVEAIMMLGLWTIFLFAQKKVTPSVLWAPNARRYGPRIGIVSACMVLTNILSIYHIDNPSYPMALHFLDSAIILAVYKLSGRRSEENVWAGMSMVVCAALLVILRAQI